MSSISSAVKTMHDTQRRVTGVRITYTRGAESVDLIAVPGESVIELTQDGEVVEVTNSRDYIVRYDELTIGGMPTTPIRGDKVTEGGITRVVLSRGGDAHWRWTDEQQVLIRIHTRQSG